MGHVTTHVLDTANGKPASGLHLEVWQLVDDEWSKLKDAVTNADGRLDSSAISGEQMAAGVYELRFHVSDYFRSIGTILPEPAFLDIVPVRFGVSDADAHYHVPLLVSPFSYSTYRGS